MNSTSKIQEEEEEAFSYALHISSMDSFIHTLSASMQLNLFDIIGRAGPNAHLTAPQITAQLPTKNPDAPFIVDRILRLLTSYSLLTCSLRNVDDFVVERSYGLSPTGHFFLTKKDGVSLAALTPHGKSPVFDAWLGLKDAILEGGNPFERAHGVPMYRKINLDQESVKEFNQAMDGLSAHITKQVLDGYNGFHGLESLVDVGGGSGLELTMILSKYPSIHGINFDLPHVVKEAPSYPGIEHVGGDMFAGVPSGDAIMMKDILHNWGDEQCIKILKNCYDSLPEDGKVIAVGHLMPEVLNPSIATKFVCQMDLLMFLTHGGKQRTEKEFYALGRAAGFSRFQLTGLAAYNAVVEFYK